MADIRCPGCGRDNPDFLNVCQFCQTPLKSESPLQIGDKPTKKTTGELEPVLPDWLRDVRQQARDSAEEDAAQAASMPKLQKDEPPDLLAGLFQSSKAEEEDVPDWLSRLTPKPQEKETPPPAAPVKPETDFFAQFNKSEPAPQSESEPDETSSWMSGSTEPPSASPERDELSEWLSKASEQSDELFTLEPDPSDINVGWEYKEATHPVPLQDNTPKPDEGEDLGWLRNLESEARKTGELSTPKQEMDWSSELGASAGFSEQDDLSWLNELGALPSSNEPQHQPSKPQEDLSWLNDISGTPDSPQPASPSSAQQEDLSWLTNLGSLPASQEPVQHPPQPREDLSWLNDIGAPPASEQAGPDASQPKEDLSWLNAFEDTSGSAQPETASPSAHEDLSWLNDLKSSPETPPAAPFAGFSSDEGQPAKTSSPPQEMPHVSPFTPRGTAPLDDKSDPSIPDWLKSATEEPSMPLGPKALDQFREDYKIPTAPEEPFSWKSFVQGLEPEPEAETRQTPPATSQPPFTEQDIFAPTGDSSTLSNQEVDSLFSVDMPDWLSRPEPAESESPAQEIGIHAEGGEALSPADLPSWVQAMRPVEAVIAESGPSVEDLPIEREGPLAGFKGVIPAAPIGSSRRPQPIPLKLQASDEQQASAALLEQILLGETMQGALVSTPAVISQRMLRWAIAGIVLIVLGAVVLLRSQVMPVSPILSPGASDITNIVTSIAEDAPVLVILDYEPGLAGEMEAVSGPFLDHLVLLRHPHLSFVTTSPSGAALVERLLANTNINRPEGHAYVAGQNYSNMGYLPGGESGVIAFIQSPQAAIPTSPVLDFSEYAAIVLLTDHAESARVWVEQLQTLKETDPALAGQPLLAMSSAQAGPMLQPYASSKQVDGLISGMAEAARFELVNNNRPGIARSYWDAFGVGMVLAIVLILLGGLWSLFTGLRTRRMEAVEE